MLIHAWMKINLFAFEIQLNSSIGTLWNLKYFLEILHTQKKRNCKLNVKCGNEIIKKKYWEFIQQKIIHVKCGKKIRTKRILVGKILNWNFKKNDVKCGKTKDRESSTVVGLVLFSSPLH